MDFLAALQDFQLERCILHDLSPGSWIEEMQNVGPLNNPFNLCVLLRTFKKDFANLVHPMVAFEIYELLYNYVHDYPLVLGVDRFCDGDFCCKFYDCFSCMVLQVASYHLPHYLNHVMGKWDDFPEDVQEIKTDYAYNSSCLICMDEDKPGEDFAFLENCQHLFCKGCLHQWSVVHDKFL